MKKEEKQNQMEPKPNLLKTKRVKTDHPLVILTKMKEAVAEGGAEEIITGEAELLLLDEVDHEVDHLVEVEEVAAVSLMLPVTTVSRPAI